MEAYVVGYKVCDVEACIVAIVPLLIIQVMSPKYDTSQDHVLSI